MAGVGASRASVPADSSGGVSSDMEELSRRCFLRVAIFVAVMICRVTQVSAKERNATFFSGRKSRMAL